MRLLAMRTAVAAGALAVAATVEAQVPKEIHAELLKIGQIVDPACTAKLYRPLMPKADFNTYWPVDAAAPGSTAVLYPGITILRDQLFGPNPKDVVDVFTSDKGGNNRPIFIYVPGGGGNKIEQQVREGNAFYDNIGRWAAKNGMVGVTVQRHPGAGNWDDGGRDLSMAVDWVKDNAPKFRGDPNRIFIAAHSAGTAPLGVYVAHPARWKNGVQVKGAIYMSGNPAPSAGGGGRGQGPGAPGGAGLPAPGSTCGTSANMGSNDGMIAGPSGQRAVAGGPGGPGGAGRAGRGGPPQLTPEQQAERDNLPGFKATPVKVMLVRAELDPGVMGDMLPSDKALHDEMCKADGEKAKSGEGHCPTLLFAKTHSHMSEVFAFDTADKSVSDPILAWVKKIK